MILVTVIQSVIYVLQNVKSQFLNPFTDMVIGGCCRVGQALIITANLDIYVLNIHNIKSQFFLNPYTDGDDRGNWVGGSLIVNFRYTFTRNPGFILDFVGIFNDFVLQGIGVNL